MTLIFLLYTPHVWSDGGAPPEGKGCTFSIGKYKLQMTVYQPENHSDIEFCQKIPIKEKNTSITEDAKRRNAIIIFDLLDQPLREMEIELNIIKESDDFPQTLVSLPAQKYLSGTMHFEWKLPSEKGRYLISIGMRDGRNTYSKQIPLELGAYSEKRSGKSMFVPVVVTILILLLIFYKYRLRKITKK
jgi:hypothetical protein